jgi:hypothetical protein
LRVAAQRLPQGPGKRRAWKTGSGQAGIGIAIETRIDSTVRVTIRHSDSEPIARGGDGVD